VSSNLTSAIYESSTKGKLMSTINHPAHYNQGSMEVIDAIEGLNLCFNGGNCLKKVCSFHASIQRNLYGGKKRSS
jgi:hypothetical protein